MIAPFGFEISTWDPSRDNFLPQIYSVDNMQGKSVCKVTLQRHLDLSEGTSEILVSFNEIRSDQLFPTLTERERTANDISLFVCFMLVKVNLAQFVLIDFFRLDAFIQTSQILTWIS